MLKSIDLDCKRLKHDASLLKIIEPENLWYNISQYFQFPLKSIKFILGTQFRVWSSHAYNSMNNSRQFPILSDNSLSMENNLTSDHHTVFMSL